MVHEFDLKRPSTIAEALEYLNAGGTPYCGGTELLAVMRLGLAQPEVLVDLKRVDELTGIVDTDHEILIKARVTHRESHASHVIQQHAGLLASATSQLGNARVRSTGTLAGNLCFAEPRSDVSTALIALNARIDLCSTEGVRTVRVDEFVDGAFTTTRGDTELVESIRIPKVPANWSYLRFHPAEYPTITVAVVRHPKGDCRVVIGAVGERPESFAFSNLNDVDAVAISSEIDISEDLNGKEDYKRHLATVFINRAIDDVRKSTSRG